MKLRHQPALALSRRPLPAVDRSQHAPASGLAHGAHGLGDAPRGDPKVIPIGPGSKVSLCVQAHEKFLGRGNSLARRRDAIQGYIRASDAGVSGQRASAPRNGALSSGTGVDSGMETLRGRNGGTTGMKTFGDLALLRNSASSRSA